MQILDKDYQINSVSKAIGAGENSIIALPTGGGKSICILKLCQALSDKHVVVSLRNAALIPQLLHTLTSNEPSCHVDIYKLTQVMNSMT